MFLNKIYNISFKVIPKTLIRLKAFFEQSKMYSSRNQWFENCRLSKYSILEYF